VRRSPKRRVKRRRGGSRHRGAEPKTSTASGGETQASQTSIYLYGVVSDADPNWQPQHPGDPFNQPRLIWYYDIAALVSDVDASVVDQEEPRTLKKMMETHYRVQGNILPYSTLWPARFGVVFPDEAAIRRDLLQGHFEDLRESLRRLEGLVEVEVRARYHEEPIVEQVLHEHPELRPSGGQGKTRREQMSYDDQIRLGEGIMEVLRSKRDNDAQQLLDQIGPVAQDVVLNQGQDELTVLNAALLIAYDKLSDFDRVLNELNAQWQDRLDLNCVGPLPAYTFSQQEMAVQ